MNTDDIRSLLDLPLLDLMALANQTREASAGEAFEVCTIMNAKSGLCSQDCRFCAQASRHATGVPTYPLKSSDEILEAARRAQDIGAQRFGIVTSGNTLTRSELQTIADATANIQAALKIDVCASLGRLEEQDLVLLRQAGISRYHHNLETAPAYFPQMCTTHTFQERVDTIRAAQRAGLEVCSGGIIGLGESWDDRIALARALQELKVTAVPLNILVPIQGTPLAGQPPIACTDAIRAIAIFRMIFTGKIIKIAAGRESVLKDFQAMGFMAGANSMLIGGYLTTAGRQVEEDWNLVTEIKKVWRKGKSS